MTYFLKRDSNTRNGVIEASEHLDMYVAPTDWNSFWDLATPTEAAAMLRESYGAGAADAALECASAAKDDARETDHFFWLAVSAELKKDPAATATASQPIAH